MIETQLCVIIVETSIIGLYRHYQGYYFVKSVKFCNFI
jgi:hypothetical protein